MIRDNEHTIREGLFEVKRMIVYFKRDCDCFF